MPSAPTSSTSRRTSRRRSPPRLKMPAASGEALVRSRTADLDAYLEFPARQVRARERGGKALADAAVLLEAGGDARSRFRPGCCAPGLPITR